MPDVIQLRTPASPEPVRESTLFTDEADLAGLINAGEHLTHPPVFGGDTWDLSGHPSWRDKAGAQCSIRFDRLPARWRVPAKELALLQLAPHLAPVASPGNAVAQAWPAIQEAVSPVTAQSNIKMLSHALATVEAHHLDLADPAAWERLTILLRQPVSTAQKRHGGTLSGLTVRARAQQLLALWQVAQIGGHTGLLGTTKPWDGRDVAQVFRKTGARNTVRPHEQVGHVLGYAAWFFDHLAENIVEHVEWWTEHISSEPPLNRDDLVTQMVDLMGQIAATNGGHLPGTISTRGNLTISYGALGRLLGCYDSDEAHTAGRSALRQLGFDPETAPQVGVTPCPIPITPLPTEDGEMVPWTTGLLPTMSELDLWQRRLVYYAMYYLAATVMLRDSQPATLPLDALRSEAVTRANGTTYTRHTLSAFRTKNRHAPTPTAVTVNARVAQVVTLLQRLQAALGYIPQASALTGLPVLFDQRLATPFGKRPHGLSRDGLYLDQSFLAHMVDGAAELHTRGVVARDLSGVSVSMRQVRITCAQAYAVREHGQALAAAFGQWDTAKVAQGYVGDVYRLITPADPEETRDLSREDIGRRLVRAQRELSESTGNGLRRLDATLDRVRPAIANPETLSASRLKTLGKNNPNIEQGPLTLCVYQPEGALCGGKGKPDFRLCLPGQCRNSAMTEADRARYELMRRQHLAANSPVLRRAADKMDDANPDIAPEFADVDDDTLVDIIKTHVEDYIRRSLEGRA